MSGVYANSYEPSTRDRSHLSLAGSTSLSTSSRTLPISKSNYTVTTNGIATYSRTYKSQPIHTSGIANHRHKPHHPSKDSQNMLTKSSSNKVASHSNSQLHNTRSSQSNLLFTSPQGVYDSSSSPSPFSSTLTSSSDFSFPTTYSSSIHTPTLPSPMHVLHKQPKKDPFSAPYSSIPQVMSGQLRPTVCGPQSVDPAMTMVLERAHVYIAASDACTGYVGSNSSGSGDSGSGGSGGGSVNTLNTSGSGSQLPNMGAGTGVGMSNYGSRFSKGNHPSTGVGNIGTGVGNVAYNPRALAIPASLLDKATRTNQPDTITSNSHRKDGYTSSSDTGAGLDSLDALVTTTYSLSRPQSSAAGIGAGMGASTGMGMGVETRQWPSFPVPQAPPLPRHTSSSSAATHGGNSGSDTVEAVVDVPIVSGLSSVAVSRTSTATATTMPSTSTSTSTAASVAGSRVATAYGHGRDRDNAMSIETGTGTGATASNPAMSSSGHAVVVTVAPPPPVRSQRHAATRASHHNKHVANVAMALNALHPVLAGEQVDLLVQQYGQDEHGVGTGASTSGSASAGVSTAQYTSTYPMSTAHLPPRAQPPTHGSSATSQDMHTLSEFLNQTRSRIPDVLPPNSLLQLSARNTQANAHTRTRTQVRAGGSFSGSANIPKSTSVPDTLVNPKDQLVLVRAGAVRSEDVETFAFLAAQGLYMPSLDASGAAMVPRLHTHAHTHSRTQALRQGQLRAETNGVRMSAGADTGAGMGVSVPRVVAPIGLSGAALALALGPSNLTSVLKQSKARNHVRVDISFTLVCVHVPLACGILREGGPRAAYQLYQHACKLGQDSGVATSLLLASTVLGNESTEQHSRFRIRRIPASASSAASPSTHQTPWWQTYQLSSLVRQVNTAVDQQVIVNVPIVENDVKNVLESRKTSVSDSARITENTENMVHTPDSEKVSAPNSAKYDLPNVDGTTDMDNHPENGISEADTSDNNSIYNATDLPENTSILDHTDIPAGTPASPSPVIDSLPLLSVPATADDTDAAETQAETGMDIAGTAVGTPSPGSSPAHVTGAPVVEPWLVPLPASPSFLASRSAHASRRASLAAQPHADIPHTHAHADNDAAILTAAADGDGAAASEGNNMSAGVGAAVGASAASRRASLARRVSFAPLPTPTPSHPVVDAGMATGMGAGVDANVAADGVVGEVGAVETPMLTESHTGVEPDAEAKAETEVADTEGEAPADAATANKSEEKKEGKANEEVETKAKATEEVATAIETEAMAVLPDERRAVDTSEEGTQPLPPPPSPPSTPPQNPELTADPENLSDPESSNQESAVDQKNSRVHENMDPESNAERENAPVQENMVVESAVAQEEAPIEETPAPELDVDHGAPTVADLHEPPTTATTTATATDTDTTAATIPTQDTAPVLDAATTRPVDAVTTPRLRQGSAGARLKWLLSCEGDESEQDEEVDVVSVASQPMYVHSTEEQVVVVLQFTIVDQDTGERFTYTPKDISHWRAQYQEQVQRDMAKSALLTQDLGSALTVQTKKAVSREAPQLQTQQPSLRSSKHLRVPLQMTHKPATPSIVRLLHLETGTITIVPSVLSNEVDGSAVH